MVIYFFLVFPQFYDIHEVSVNSTRIVKTTHASSLAIAASVLIATVVAYALQVSKCFLTEFIL